MRYLILGALGVLCVSIIGAWSSSSRPLEKQAVVSESRSPLASLIAERRPARTVAYAAQQSVRVWPAVSVHEAEPEVVAAAEKRVSRAGLVLNIQRALRSLNCGPLRETGVWDAATMKSMQTLIAATNAKLPVDHPEEAFLALIQARRDAGMSDCTTPSQKVPQKALAAPRLETASESAESTGNAVASAGADALPGRMSLGGPTVAAAPAAAPRPEPVKAYAPSRKGDDYFLHPLGRL